MKPDAAVIEGVSGLAPGPYAFPFTLIDDTASKGCPGMTLRDYFAAAALAPVISDNLHGDDYARYAEDAYVLADAMLAERAK